MMVRDFQRVIGVEARAQVLELTGRLPDAVAACVGGGSNAIGIFHAFLDDPGVALYGFEAGGDGVETGRHAATITGGALGVLHGARTYLLQDDDGPDDRVALDLGRPGLPGRRPRARLAARHRPRDVPRRSPTPQAMDAFALLCRTEGIIPAIESAHALAGALRARPRARARTAVILVNLSGRGDKDVDTAAALVRPRRRRELVGRGRARRRADAGAPASGGDALATVLSPTRGPRAGPRWSATCPAGFPTVDGAIDACARWSRPASTSSRSACPTPTR